MIPWHVRYVFNDIRELNEDIVSICEKGLSEASFQFTKQRGEEKGREGRHKL
jgi:hypothetical protein